MRGCSGRLGKKEGLNRGKRRKMQTLVNGGGPCGRVKEGLVKGGRWPGKRKKKSPDGGAVVGVERDGF